MNHSSQYYYQPAATFDIPASYYQYSDPPKHVSFYYQHLQALHKAMNRQYQSRGYRQSAKARIFHASSDSQEVDIYINGRKLLTAINYRSMSEYFSMPAGPYRADIFKTGTTRNPILSFQIVLMPGQYYTFALAGTVNRLFFLPVAEKPFVAAGETKINLVHLSPDTPPVDISVKNETKLLSRLPYGRASAFVKVDSGRKDYTLSLAGSEDILLPIPKLNLKTDKAYTLFAIGFINGSPILEVIHFENG